MVGEREGGLISDIRPKGRPPTGRSESAKLIGVRSQLFCNKGALGSFVVSEGLFLWVSGVMSSAHEQKVDDAGFGQHESGELIRVHGARQLQDGAPLVAAGISGQQLPSAVQSFVKDKVLCPLGPTAVFAKVGVASLGLVAKLVKCQAIKKLAGADGDESKIFGFRAALEVMHVIRAVASRHAR